MRKPKIVKLNNGATLLYLKTKKKASAWRLSFLGGSTEDKKEGTAHFLEHMLFKETDNRSFEQINKDRFEICFANAKTGAWYTAMETRRTNKLAEESLSFLTDLLLHSKLNEETIEKEKGVIQEELNRQLDNYKITVQNYHYAQMYETDYDYPKTLGTTESINSMNKEDLEEYRGRNYVIQNFLMGAVTRFPLYKVKALYRKIIEPQIPVPQNYIPIKKLSSEPNKDESLNIVKNENIEQVKCMISIVFNVGYEQYANRTVGSYIPTLIGAGTSPLFIKLRNEGLIYVFDRMTLDKFPHCTVATFGFKSSKDKLKRIIDVIGECFKDIYNNGMDKTTFDQRTLNLKYLDDEAADVVDIMNDLSRIWSNYILDGKFYKPYKWEKENKKLKLEYVNEVFKTILSKENKMYITYLGNVAQEDVYTFEETKSKLLF